MARRGEGRGAIRMRLVDEYQRDIGTLVLDPRITKPGDTVHLKSFVVPER